MVILSGSANNEFPLKLTDFQKVDFNEVVTDLGNDIGVTLGFTEAEFEVWADHFKEDLEDVNLPDLMYVTNLIPLELGLFLQTKKCNPQLSFPEVLEMYREARMATLRKRHTRYSAARRQEGNLDQFVAAARRLYLNMGGGKTDLYDRQLMYFHQSHFRAITSLAFQVLFEENNIHFG